MRIEGRFPFVDCSSIFFIVRLNWPPPIDFIRNKCSNLIVYGDKILIKIGIFHSPRFRTEGFVHGAIFPRKDGAKVFVEIRVFVSNKKYNCNNYKGKSNKWKPPFHSYSIDIYYFFGKCMNLFQKKEIVRINILFKNKCEMGSAISKSNQDYINENWNELKCSPIGPLLQIVGVGPGDVNETSNQCKASAFSSQFNSSMVEHLDMTAKLTDGLSMINNTMDKFRAAIASIEQSAFNDLSQVATQIFNIYVKIGNIFYVMTKNLINIMNIFKSTVNFGASVAKLLIEFMDLLRVPINGIISFIEFFTRGI